jgi:endonuclease/exonuclease/phosphatase family metal-dependent hydrolase
MDELAAELQAMQADVMGLQEVDSRARRSGFTDQAPALAKALAAHYVFAASIKWDGGDYGLALLSRWPLVEVRRHRLELASYGEPRIVLEVTVCARGRPLRLFNHHAAVGRRSREVGLAQVRALVAPHVGRGTVVLGDLNDVPSASNVRALLDAGFVDVGADQDLPTTGGGRIDYVLLDKLLASGLRGSKVWPTRKSDHHAFVAEFVWCGCALRARERCASRSGPRFARRAGAPRRLGIRAAKRQGPRPQAALRRRRPPAAKPRPT